MAVTVFQAIDPTWGIGDPAPFPSGYRKVATVDVADDQLGLVFRHTNTIDYSWYGPERPAIVTLSKYVEKEGGARSTSVGDVIALSDGSLKLCASAGWDDMATFDHPLVFEPGSADAKTLYAYYLNSERWGKGTACMALFLARIANMHHHLEAAYIGGDGCRNKAYLKWVSSCMGSMLPRFSGAYSETNRMAYAKLQADARSEAKRIFDAVDSLHPYS